MILQGALKDMKAVLCKMPLHMFMQPHSYQYTLLHQLTLIWIFHDIPLNYTAPGLFRSGRVHTKTISGAQQSVVGIYTWTSHARLMLLGFS